MRHLVGDALLEFRIPFLELFRLPLHLVLQRLHAEQRAHAREELGLVDRLRQKIVGARLDAFQALALRIKRRHQDHRQQRGFRLRADAPADVVPGQARHHHIEQYEIGLVRGELRKRLFAIRRRRHAEPFHRQQIGQQLDVGGGVVDDENFRRLAHPRGLSRMRLTVLRNSLRSSGLPR
jgi:hypothetical protein